MCLYNCLYHVSSVIYTASILDDMCLIVIVFIHLTRHDVNSCTNTIYIYYGYISPIPCIFSMFNYRYISPIPCIFSMFNYRSISPVPSILSMFNYRYISPVPSIFSMFNYRYISPILFLACLTRGSQEPVSFTW